MPSLFMKLILAGWCLVAFAWVDCDCIAAEPPPKTNATRDVVLWISLDGLRSDYLTRGETPQLNRLMKEGVYSLELEPIFPSITFPSHVSQATGVRVAQHGIPSNSFYDAATDKSYRYPSYGSLLEAEPIWLTAARQKVRVASMDWPLSHAQRGDVVAAYFEMKFDGAKTDAQRLDRVLEVWQNDKADEPLRLLMGYVVGTDKSGHEHGPDSREVFEAMKELDTLIGEFIAKAVKAFEQHRRGDEQLYVLLTTDHGMTPVKTLVHLGFLAEVEGREGIEMSTGGGVGDIFFKADMPNREAAIKGTLQRLASYKFAKAWKRDDLPAEWELNHASRVGDIVVSLDPGYTFSRTSKEATSPVTERGPLGMHGYDPQQNLDMLGPMILWRYPTPLTPRKLERVHSLQLHPTVAKLLGILPSEKAKEKAIDLKP